MTHIQTHKGRFLRNTRQQHRARLRQLSQYLFLLPAVLFMAATTLYPLVLNLRMSFYDLTVTTFLSSAAPFVGFGNYRTVMSDPTFQHGLRLSVLFTAGSLAGQFTLGFALALLFRRSFPGNNVLRALLLLGWMLPVVVSGSIFRWMFDGSFGIINLLLQNLGLSGSQRFWLTEPNYALLGVMLVNIWIGIPFNMALLLPGLQSIPSSLYEAASIDGANDWHCFWHITLPVIRPVALSVALLGIIYTFKVFDLIYVMTRGGPVDATTTLPIYIYTLAFQFFRFGEASATAMLVVGVLTVVAGGYVWLSRQEDIA